MRMSIGISNINTFHAELYSKSDVVVIWFARPDDRSDGD